MIVNTSVKQVAVDQLRPHPDNPRKGNIDAIVESIQANGFYGAIVAQAGTNTILVGNHRWQAAQRAGLAKVPVVFVDVDDEQAKRILLADNRTSDLSSYDSEALVKLLNGMDLFGTGYDESALDDIVARLDLPTPVGVPIQGGGGERTDAAVVQWGYMQWKSTRVRIAQSEVEALDKAYADYRAGHGSDVGFAFYLTDRTESQAQ